MKWLLSLQLLKEIKTETCSGFVVIVVSIFTIRLVCCGETLVKLQVVYHKYHFPDISLPWYRQDIQFLKTCKLFSQDKILGLSYWETKPFPSPQSYKICT